MGLWTGLLVQAALFLCVKPLMVSTSQCYQILWSVVIANAVDVVNVHVRVKWLSVCLFPHQTMFQHIAATRTGLVRARMFRGVHQHIARIYHLTTLEQMVIWPGSLARVTAQERDRMPLEVPHRTNGSRCQWGRLAATTLAQPGRNLIRCRGVLPGARLAATAMPLKVFRLMVAALSVVGQWLPTATRTQSSDRLQSFFRSMAVAVDTASAILLPTATRTQLHRDLLRS